MFELHQVHIRQALQERFTQAGLLPEHPTLEEQRRLSFTAGDAVFTDIAAEIGRPALLIGLNACRFQGWASDGTSLAGWGCRIADFVLFPVVRPPEARERLARLGALAHLIIALYDHARDHLPPGTVTLTPAELHRWLDGDAPTARRQLTLRRPVDHLVRQLVLVYLAWQSDSAALTSQPGLLQFTRRLIGRMFAADPDAHLPTGRARAARITRDVFPFLVMGVPGWAFAAAPDRRTVHFLFLYRYGRFIGLLDDALDAAEDHQAGRPNLVGLSAEADRIAGSLTARGIAVLDTWRGLAPGKDPERQEAQLSMFRHSLLSWFHLPTNRYNFLK